MSTYDQLAGIYYILLAGELFYVLYPLYQLTTIAVDNTVLYKILCQNQSMPQEKLGCLLQRFEKICPRALLFNFFEITPKLLLSGLLTVLTPLLIRLVSFLLPSSENYTRMGLELEKSIR